MLFHFLPSRFSLFFRPLDIVQDIFPRLDLLNLSLSSDNSAFDQALGEIINIIVSFDMGWSKRGTGRSYDSLNGYSTIIGFLSGKILDYATRNRKCKKCDLGYKKEEHDCRLNFCGSAKAMEADAGVQLINHSNILKEVGLQVRVIIGDEDSSMIAAVRADEPNQKFHNLADKNHLTKNFAGELYKMSEEFKELKKKDVIPHIKKCFTYAVSQNRGKPQNLATNLKQIPDHIFNRHENCGSWCNPDKKHTLNLSDENLHEELVRFFEKYASNSHKFSVAASSQGNESFNNIVANKAHKNKCLSTSAACDIRVAEAVCVKNDGEESILHIKRKMNIPSGSRTIEFVKRSDSKRLQRSQRSQSKDKKLRRLELKKMRQLLRKTTERAEGVTYQSNCGFNKLNINPSEGCDNNILEENTNIVYFDIETTGLAADAHILQIAAMCEHQTFDVYISTKKKISPSASAVTQLHHKHGALFYRDKEVETLKIGDALESLQQFLFNLCDGKKKCLLVAHNAPFDVPRLLRAIDNAHVHGVLDLISGFADTLALFRRTFTDRKGPGQFKLETLSRDFLQAHDDQQTFHDAAYDVSVLQTLTKTLKLESNLFNSCKNYKYYLQEITKSDKTKSNLPFLTELFGIITMNMCKKLASNDISCDSLRKIYEDGGEKAIIQLFTEQVENKKVRITKKKDIITKVLHFLKNPTSPGVKCSKKKVNCC